MLGRASNRARRGRVQRAFGEFRNDLLNWVTRRQADDLRGQYQSQLDSLKTCLLQVTTDIIEAPLAEMDLDQPRADTYEQCRKLELRLNWVRRLWTFYRERFDQREDPKRSPLLKAADEVVWSCYRSVFKEGPTPVRPAPLPFVEFEYSPLAIPCEYLPHQMVSGENPELAFLRAQLPLLPIALLQVPATCVDEPWWLIHVAHEIGHHVQFALASNNELVEQFRIHVVKAIEPHASIDEANRWSGWTTEIFADIFAVHAMGAPAVSSMVEAELKKDMTGYPSKYPPAVVRLEMMAQVADQLGLKGRAALQFQGIEPAVLAQHNTSLKGTLGLVPKVVDAVLAPLPVVNKTFRQLCEPTPVREEVLEAWKQKLLASALPAVTPRLDAARQLTGGAFLAWLDLVDKESPDHRSLALGQQVIQAIQNGAPGGTRAAATAISDKTTASALAERIRAMTPDQLEGVRAR